MYIKNEAIVARHIHDTNFLIDITDNYMDEKCRLYEISDTGMYIWSVIEECSGIKEITESLIKIIADEVDYGVVYDDVSEFVGLLLNQGFVKEIQ
ncbi:MAG: PqqD family protein [Ruminococcus sp.]